MTFAPPQWTDHEYRTIKFGEFEAEVFRSGDKYGGRVWAGEIGEDPNPFLLPAEAETTDLSPFPSWEDATGAVLKTLSTTLSKSVIDLLAYTQVQRGGALYSDLLTEFLGGTL